MRLKLPDDDLTSFVGCFTLGMLHAIRTGTIPAETGIWTLGRPRMWELLAHREAIPPDLVDVLQTCDELTAILKLPPGTFDAELDALIGRVEAILAGVPDHRWEVTWEDA